MNSVRDRIKESESQSTPPANPIRPAVPPKPKKSFHEPSPESTNKAYPTKIEEVASLSFNHTDNGSIVNKCPSNPLDTQVEISVTPDHNLINYHKKSDLLQTNHDTHNISTMNNNVLELSLTDDDNMSFELNGSVYDLPGLEKFILSGLEDEIVPPICNSCTVSEVVKLPDESSVIPSKDTICAEKKTDENDSGSVSKKLRHEIIHNSIYRHSSSKSEEEQSILTVAERKSSTASVTSKSTSRKSIFSGLFRSKRSSKTKHQREKVGASEIYDSDSTAECSDKGRAKQIADDNDEFEHSGKKPLNSLFNRDWLNTLGDGIKKKATVMSELKTFFSNGKSKVKKRPSKEKSDVPEVIKMNCDEDIYDDFEEQWPIESDQKEDENKKETKKSKTESEKSKEKCLPSDNSQNLKQLKKNEKTTSEICKMKSQKNNKQKVEKMAEKKEKNQKDIKLATKLKDNEFYDDDGADDITDRQEVKSNQKDEISSKLNVRTSHEPYKKVPVLYFKDKEVRVQKTWKVSIGKPNSKKDLDKSNEQNIKEKKNSYKKYFNTKADKNNFGKKSKLSKKIDKTPIEIIADDIYDDGGDGDVYDDDGDGDGDVYDDGGDGDGDVYDDGGDGDIYDDGGDDEVEVPVNDFTKKVTNQLPGSEKDDERLQKISVVNLKEAKLSSNKDNFFEKWSSLITDKNNKNIKGKLAIKSVEKRKESKMTEKNNEIETDLIYDEDAGDEITSNGIEEEGKQEATSGGKKIDLFLTQNVAENNKSVSEIKDMLNNVLQTEGRIDTKTEPWKEKICRQANVESLSQSSSEESIYDDVEDIVDDLGQPNASVSNIYEYKSDEESNAKDAANQVQQEDESQQNFENTMAGISSETYYDEDVDDETISEKASESNDKISKDKEETPVVDHSDVVPVPVPIKKSSIADKISAEIKRRHQNMIFNLGLKQQHNNRDISMKVTQKPEENFEEYDKDEYISEIADAISEKLELQGGKQMNIRKPLGDSYYDDDDMADRENDNFVLRPSAAKQTNLEKKDGKFIAKMFQEKGGNSKHLFQSQTYDDDDMEDVPVAKTIKENGNSKNQEKAKSKFQKSSADSYYDDDDMAEMVNEKKNLPPPLPIRNNMPIKDWPKATGKQEESKDIDFEEVYADEDENLPELIPKTEMLTKTNKEQQMNIRKPLGDSYYDDDDMADRENDNFVLRPSAAKQTNLEKKDGKFIAKMFQEKGGNSKHLFQSQTYDDDDMEDVPVAKTIKENDNFKNQEKEKTKENSNEIFVEEVYDEDEALPKSSVKVEISKEKTNKEKGKKKKNTKESEQTGELHANENASSQTEKSSIVHLEQNPAQNKDKDDELQKLIKRNLAKSVKTFKLLEPIRPIAKVKAVKTCYTKEKLYLCFNEGEILEIIEGRKDGILVKNKIGVCGLTMPNNIEILKSSD